MGDGRWAMNDRETQETKDATGMKTLAPHDRPREKLDRIGAAALGDNELLAIILGHGVPNSGVLDLANAVLHASGGLHGLARTSTDELRRVPGIGAARAAQLVAAVEAGRRTLLRGRRERVRITNATDVARVLVPEFGLKPVEHFGVLLLDTKHQVLRTRLVSVGTLDASIVHPREVFRDATVAGAAAVILFHNHPSGDPRPSGEDLALTRRLMNAGDIMGIAVLDHLILVERGFRSLRESGDLRDGTP
jgi:DNA repair protein RadC